jgi:hypothetical protein
LKRSDSIRNSFSANPKSQITVPQNAIPGGRTSGSTPAAGNGIFGCRDRAPKIAIQTRERPQRPRIQEMSGRESRQKRPIWRGAGTARFARTGWWRMQSCETGLQWRIPCYREFAGNFADFPHFKRPLACRKPKHCNGFLNEFPTQISRESTPLDQGKLWSRAGKFANPDQTRFKPNQTARATLDIEVIGGIFRRFDRAWSTSCRRRASFTAFGGQRPAASPTIDRVCHLGGRC